MRASSSSVLAQVIQNATTIISEWAIDLSQYEEAEFYYTGDGAQGFIEWTHKTNKNVLSVSGVYFDEGTGEILQYGSTYGELVL